MKKRKQILIYLLLCLSLVLVLFPMFYMIILAFTPTEYMFQGLIPKRLTLDHIIKVFSSANLTKAFLNSWIISIGTMVLSVSLAIFAGYGLSRFKFRLKNFYILIILLTQMMPLVLLAIGYFRLTAHTWLYNTHLLLILVDSTLAAPFATLLLRNTFDALPRELEEAAMIDGCSKIKAFFKVTLPLARAGVFSAAFFSFLQGWVEYLYGLTLTSDITARPMTVELAWMLGHYVVSWGDLMAASFVFSVPVFIVFLFLQDAFLKGLTQGALKE